MSTPCEQYRTNWDLLVLGALEADLQQEMSLHLRECEGCREDFLNCRAVSDVISTVAPDDFILPSTGGPSVSAPPMPASSRFSRILPWAAAAAILAVFGGIAGFRIAALERQAGLQSRDLAALRRMVNVVEAPSVRNLDLKEMDPSVRGASARATWSHGGMLFFARGLPALPPAKCYQLWILRKSSPPILSGGILQLDRTGAGLLYVPPTQDPDQVTGFAITDEPQGGSAVAKGRKLLAGVE